MFVNSYQSLFRAGFHVVSIGICVLQSITTPGQQSRSIKEILPVYPGPTSSHHLLLNKKS